jgi:ABC-type branched-subunit amino acid transport system substrate-binding protein
MDCVRKTAASFLALLVPVLLMARPVVASSDAVVVHRGGGVEIAVVLDRSGVLSAQGAGARNAVQMAVDKHPAVRGFPVQLNDFDGPCGSPQAGAAVAAEVAANSANVAVIGHMCSIDERAALPIYEQAGLVTISGSATNPTNPAFGPHVFNSLIVPDDTPGESDAWYSLVRQLPRDLTWQAEYEQRFGSAPTSWADLYYDATTLLLNQLAASSSLAQGDLMINRSALAAAVRSLARGTPLGFNGVTCWVNLDARGYRVNDPAGLDRCAGQT